MATGQSLIEKPASEHEAIDQSELNLIAAEIRDAQVSIEKTQSQFAIGPA